MKPVVLAILLTLVSVASVHAVEPLGSQRTDPSDFVRQCVDMCESDNFSDYFDSDTGLVISDLPSGQIAQPGAAAPVMEGNRSIEFEMPDDPTFVVVPAESATEEPGNE